MPKKITITKNKKIDFILRNIDFRHFLGFMLVFKRKLNDNKYNIYIRNQHHLSFNL